MNARSARQTRHLCSGVPELLLGSAGSNRINGAILQAVVNVVDRGMLAQDAVDTPRLHAQDGVMHIEPGIDAAALEAAGYTASRFRARNMFFGGWQVVERGRGIRELAGGGDYRRGAVVVA